MHSVQKRPAEMGPVHCHDHVSGEGSAVRGDGGNYWGEEGVELLGRLGPNVAQHHVH